MGNTLDDVKDHLLSIHQGTFEANNYLGPWFSSEASDIPYAQRKERGSIILENAGSPVAMLPN